MIKRILATAIVALVVAVPGSAFAQDEAIAIRKINTADFPRVRLTVSTTEDDPDSIEIEENGVAVSDVEVQSFVERGEVVDVALAVDTSGSMEGAPLQAAIEAATSFVEALPENVRVGLVTFDDDATVVEPITDDHDKVLSSISGLVPVGETALYDGVFRAASMFSGENQRNIVLLSDGGDTVSSNSLGDATSAATDANAAIYAVGLEGSEFDEKALQSLAKASDGSYSPVASVDLAALYEGIAAQIEGQYFVFYESGVASGEEISLVVSDASGEDTALALAPTVEPTAVPSAKTTPPVDEDKFLEGDTGMVVVLGVTFVAIFGLLYLFLMGGAKDRKDRDLARRMGAGGGTQAETFEEPATGPVAWIPSQMIEIADEIANRRGSATAIERRLERAGWKLKVGEFLAGVVLAGLFGLVLGLLLVQKLFFGIIAMFVAGAIPVALLSIRTSRRQNVLHAQLPDILSILASSLRAGHSFLQGLDAVGREIGGPGGEEFGRLTAEIRLGKTVDAALVDLAERIGSDDFRWAVLAVTVQREVGGNLAEVLDQVADTMREREQVRRQVEVLSAEGRLSLYILAGLPVAIGLYMALVNPDYLSLLFTTRIGVVMLITAICLEALGVIWMKKVVKIDV